MQAEKMNPDDLVATWDVRLADGHHKVMLEHGSTSGKRVIFVDGVEVGMLLYITTSFELFMRIEGDKSVCIILLTCTGVS